MGREQHSERPDLEQYSETPLFTAKFVAQQTGIAAATLRTWERRYRILSPERARNDYRLYSQRDMALLEWLKERIDTGMPISQAIALYRQLEQEYQQFLRGGGLPERTPPLQESVVTRARSVQAASTEGVGPGQAVPYDMRVARLGLLEAFRAFDEVAADHLLAPLLAVYSVEQVCAELVTPTLWEIGCLWEQGSLTVSAEHFASAYFHRWLSTLLHAAPGSQGHAPVLVCCAPGELHELAPLMLTLLLRRAGLPVIYLGQSVEPEGLLQVVGQLSPTLLCLSATITSAVPALVELGVRVKELPAPRPALVFGGQAFEGRSDLAARVPGVYVAGEMLAVVTRLRAMVTQRAGERHRSPPFDAAQEEFLS